MVVNMIEKKDPHQKISLDDFDDDDDIIELTDEVIIKPEDDDEIIDLQGTGTVVPKTAAGTPLKTDKNEPESDGEEDTIALEATPEAESRAEGGAIDPDKGVSDYESTVAEDDIIASAIVASLSAKIFVLPDGVQIFPGHGNSTILEKERQAFESFSARPHSPGLCGDVLWSSS
jgi:hypothetical protein